MIEVYLSTDGKHTVHIQAEDKDEMDKLLPYAKAVYQKIIESLGSKPEMWSSVMNGQKRPDRSFGVRIDTPQQAQEVLAPLCPVHQTAMKQREGQYGKFWSCGRKNPDGSWCQEKSSQEYLNP